MGTDDLWVVYDHTQRHANARILSDQAWAVDDALEAILDKIAQKQSISVKQIDNLISNRSTKYRRRRYSLAKYSALFSSVAANDSARVEAQFELRRFQARCTDREWKILISIGFGHTYSRIAAVEGVPESTVKTWVRRVRVKLAA